VPAGVDYTGGPVSSANPDTLSHIKEWGGPLEEGRQRCHPADVPAV